MESAARKSFPHSGILISDLKNYSKLDQYQLEALHQIVFPNLYRSIMLGNEGVYFEYKNTWGDGLILICKDYEALAHIALRMQQFFLSKNYINSTTVALKNSDIQPRIALHFGEILGAIDPFKEEFAPFGEEIVLPARMEPKTPEGKVWVTSNFKNEIESSFRKKGQKTIFLFASKGTIELPKSFGNKDIWELSYEGAGGVNPTGGLITTTEKEQKEHIGPDPSLKNAMESEKKISAIFGVESDINSLLSDCTNYKDKFACQRNTLLLFSELFRNNSAMGETVNTVKLLSDFREISTSVIKEIEDKTRPENIQGIINECGRLRRKIIDIYDFFSKLKRNHDGEQSWNSNPHIRFVNYIKFRFGIIPNNEIDKFMSSFELIGKLVSNLSYSRCDIMAQHSDITEKVLSTEFYDALYHCVRIYDCFLEPNLEQLSKKRKDFTRESITKTFLGSDEKMYFSEKIKNCIKNLPHYNDRLPAIWR